MGTTILEELIDPGEGTLSADLARYVLSLHFRPERHARIAELSDKANEGTLTEEERADLEELIYADHFLAVLKSKARVSLKQTSAA